MAKPKIVLDHKGIEVVLKSGEVSAEVKALAERVADAVDIDAHAEHLNVRVDVYETDRAAAAVVLAHPSGMAHQAKYGTLTKAAAAAGVEVRAYPPKA